MAPALDFLSPLVWSQCPLLAITVTAVTGLPKKEVLLPAASFSKPRGAWVRRSFVGPPESRNVLGLTMVALLNCHLLSSELPVPAVLGL